MSRQKSKQKFVVSAEERISTLTLYYLKCDGKLFPFVGRWWLDGDNDVALGVRSRLIE